MKQAEKSSTQMLGGISHELRTPLSNIKGYLEALSLGMIQGDPAIYRMLYQESVHLTELVEQFHQLTVWKSGKVKPLSLEEVNMKELLKSCIQNFALELQQKTIAVRGSVSPVMVQINKDGIKKVLNNLLENAIQYDIGRTIDITGKIEADNTSSLSPTSASQFLKKRNPAFLNVFPVWIAPANRAGPDWGSP
ncbi:sensor histidine kinase [Thermoactinomyces mirandus]|uniref:histidine kinase n=1 Tax=Thermoactinomyces mirandus TaxID=2756294 RepID=A0A7W1XRS3_9BACL|nr:HAMP domain-containing sensor histidine kinase [Thermoactinomyces mirandus]MBA4601931.1 HAMP domain-containing histidine kinase [Thermoactinomyces mirandus]